MRWLRMIVMHSSLTSRRHGAAKERRAATKKIPSRRQARGKSEEEARRCSRCPINFARAGVIDLPREFILRTAHADEVDAHRLLRGEAAAAGHELRADPGLGQRRLTRAVSLGETGR